MSLIRNHAGKARALGVITLAGLGLGACATYDDDFAAINTRLDQLDSRVQAASQNAENANRAAQSANQAAQGAAAEARTANQRLDALETRVNQVESGPVRQPRG